MTTPIDLRSDTVTLPPTAMRAAMAQAALGDDVYREDPTVNAFEARVAEVLGKAAALFVPTGVMGNLLAVLTHCRRGDEVIVGDRSHMFLNEAGAPSVLGGTTVRTVPTAANGELAPADLAAAVRAPDNVHFPRTGLMCLENTHNFTGGQVLDATYMARVRAVADQLGVPVHLDGARLFNAAIALGVSPASLAADVDSLMVCFSKGLATPVGSVLAGGASFIDGARHWRKALGGGMRQAGVLAAAGHYALDHMLERLAEDHVHARVLADGLAAIPGLDVAQPVVATNIVMIDVRGVGDRLEATAPALLERLAANGVRASQVSPQIIRFVTHWGIERADIDEALKRVSKALA